MIKIKTATVSDAKIIALLGRITYVESHGHFIDDKNDLSAYCDTAFSVKKTADDLKNPNNLFYIASLDDLPIGFAKVVLKSPFEDKTSNTSCRLERIYILNEFIPMKIGYKFLTFVEEKAKENKATSLWLSVYIKNERAINFYDRNEFENIGELNFLVNGKEYKNFVLSKKI